MFTAIFASVHAERTYPPMETTYRLPPRRPASEPFAKHYPLSHRAPANAASDPSDVYPTTSRAPGAPSAVESGPIESGLVADPNFRGMTLFSSSPTRERAGFGIQAVYRFAVQH